MPPRQNSNSKLPGSSSSISLNESPTEETNYDSDISNDDHAIAEGDDDEDELDEGFELEVSTLTGNRFSVMIHPSDTVEVLKTRIAFQEGISPADQNLLLEQGKLLDTADTIQELNIDRNSKLTLVTNVASGVPFKSFRNPGDTLSSSSSSSKLAPTIKRNYHNTYNNNNNNNYQSSSVRLPKILTNNSNSNSLGNLNASATLDRLDEREWMQSLFNKVVQPEDGLDADGSILDNYDIDSTKAVGVGGSMRGDSRFGNNLTEEEGSILVVQGDDGVILIIQKNTGQLLDDYSFESNNYDGNNNNRSHAVDLEICNGKFPRMGRYKSNIGNSTSRNTYHTRRYYHDSKVHEKIRENAVTLEKMRQVRSMMANKHRMEKVQPDSETKPLEFPKITDSASSMAGISDLRRDSSTSDNLSFTHGVRKDNRSTTTGTTGRRSINSSKMSLNRLIAEIYLQSKRKGYAFQPGQPPYSQQQLLKYVQLKVDILLDEKSKNNTDPCTKCQQDEEWAFNETAPYLIPTVVLNRFQRLANVRNSKSLDKESIGGGGGDINSSSSFKQQLHSSGPKHQRDNNSNANGYPTSGHPRLSERRAGRSVTKSGVAPTNSSTISRKSSSSTGPRRLSCSIGNNNTLLHTLESVEENNGNIDSSSCDISNQYYYGRYENGNVTTTKGHLPSFKVYPRMPSINGLASRKSSRPGSSSKGGTGKKGVRCHVCRKKLGIACRYQCRCGMTFCSVHRYPETHECTFDYKTEGRNKIRENNPVIVAQKIPEI